MLRHVRTGDQSTQETIQHLKQVESQLFSDIKSQLKLLEERLSYIRSQENDQTRLLSSGTKHTIQLKPGSQNFFKILSKNKPTPMFVRISNCQNPKDFKIFISQTETKPDKKNSSTYQNTATGDWEIKIEGKKNQQSNQKKDFAHDFFYMGVFSNHGTIAQITIQFGMAAKNKQKRQIKAHQLLRSFKAKRDPYDEFLDNLIEHPQQSKRFYERVEQIRKEKVLRSLYMAGNRDLVLENILKAEKQIDVQKKLSLQAFEESQKLRNATEKREQQEKMKMRKMRFFMVRRDIMKKLKLQAQEEEQELQERFDFVRKWSSILFLKRLMKGHQKPVQERFENFMRQRRNMRLIQGLQRAIRRFLYRKHNSKQRSGSKFASTLKMVYMATKSKLYDQARQGIYGFLQDEFQRKRLVQKFQMYKNNVMKLQHMWIEVLKVSRLRQKSLENIWQMQKSSIIKQILAIRTNKGKKQRKDFLRRLNLITPEQKKKYIEDHLQYSRLQHKIAFEEWRNKLKQQEDKKKLIDNICYRSSSQMTQIQSNIQASHLVNSTNIPVVMTKKLSNQNQLSSQNQENNETPVKISLTTTHVRDSLAHNQYEQTKERVVKPSSSSSSNAKQAIHLQIEQIQRPTRNHPISIGLNQQKEQEHHTQQIYPPFRPVGKSSSLQKNSAKFDKGFYTQRYAQKKSNRVDKAPLPSNIPAPPQQDYKMSSSFGEMFNQIMKSKSKQQYDQSSNSIASQGAKIVKKKTLINESRVVSNNRTSSFAKQQNQKYFQAGASVGGGGGQGDAQDRSQNKWLLHNYDKEKELEVCPISHLNLVEAKNRPIFRYIPSKELIRKMIFEAASSDDYS